MWSKKNLILSLCIIHFFVGSVFAQEVDDSVQDFDLTLEDLDAFEKEHPFSQFQTKSAISLDLIADLISGKMPPLTNPPITEPLWKNTKAPTGRDILYLLPHKITAIEYGGLAFTYFFNQTNRMPVTVQDLLALESAVDKTVFFEFLKAIAPAINPQDAQQLLPLFGKLSIQERKSGILMQGGFVQGPFTIQLQTALVLGERNFWLNDKDAQTIRDCVQAVSGGQKISNKEGFIIRVGMGDTRLKIGLNTINMTNFQNDIGIEAIFPTSLISYSSRINLKSGKELYDINNIEVEGKRILQAIRDYLLTPQLGNGGHFGLGCYMESKINIFYNMAQLWFRASYDVLFPANEDRLFMYKQTIRPEDLSGLVKAVTTSAEKEALMNQFIRQYGVPTAFRINTCPGGIFNFIGSVSADVTKNWKLAFGYDFYAQQEEIIKKLLDTDVNMHDLRIDDGRSGRVHQHKIFSEVMFQTKNKWNDYGLAFGGDVTVSQRGNIGRDWTAYFKYSTSF